MTYSDDATLLCEIKLGNHDAFEYLFKSYYPRLRGYAIRFVENEEVANDIIQECFMRFWEKRHLLTSLSISSLLFAMVRNACLNYLKHLLVVEQHKISYTTVLEGEERLYYTDFFLEADQKLLYKELEEQIQLVLNKLPERTREIILLSRFKSMKNKDIANHLHISTTAVEKHISKAILAFAQHFQKNYPMEIFMMVLSWVIMDSNH